MDDDQTLPPQESIGLTRLLPNGSVVIGTTGAGGLRPPRFQNICFAPPPSPPQIYTPEINQHWLEIIFKLVLKFLVCNFHEIILARDEDIILFTQEFQKLIPIPGCPFYLGPPRLSHVPPPLVVLAFLN